TSSIALRNFGRATGAVVASFDDRSMLEIDVDFHPIVRLRRSGKLSTLYLGRQAHTHSGWNGKEQVVHRACASDLQQQVKRRLFGFAGQLYARGKDVIVIGGK